MLRVNSQRHRINIYQDSNSKWHMCLKEVNGKKLLISDGGCIHKIEVVRLARKIAPSFLPLDLYLEDKHITWEELIGKVPRDE